ncbi:MAG TPA: enolase C-terminal domain-like protein [Bryobacteraceae bacterium]|nr:enolase C-terminal domain-like protein [Bryobacteraceae bacterium]HOQ46869.1 enolase C-terminal domain-like protein [Bryobacteraceae bacterium]HPQ16499.1 enolase C-terminal domain-like protein [Bryobacteraceae bacterium]HPU72994.1 enolase C-terminal domain-like protein [Bryobacteraceae bacterium]
MKITSVRLVRTRPRRPVPSYRPAPGSWSTQGVEVANPMSIYPKYKANRALFFPDPGHLGGFTVEIATDKGIKGYGSGGPGGGAVVEGNLRKLLLGEDPFDIERLWDMMWRATMHYGRMGIAINGISGVDIALWDLIGNALNMPVYKLIGGATKDRIPAYCTGNDIEQHAEFGFKMLKLAMPHGPADGREGMRKNLALVERARKALGPDGEIMLDCWMAWTERYTLEMAEMLAPLRVYWMEECLQPHDYEGFGRLNAQIKSTRIATGEHEYTRYGFRQLLEHRSASIWQPDMHWCGGLTEMRRIAALAAAYDIPVIPHGGGQRDAVHFVMATTNSPWAELFMPAPGGPPEVYRRFEEDNQITRGPEGIYVRPSDRPGFGWEFEVV